MPRDAESDAFCSDVALQRAVANDGRADARHWQANRAVAAWRA